MSGAIQRVHIVGMGALGLLYGSMIAEHMGAEHVSYVMDSARYARHREDAYEINGTPVKFPVLRQEDAKPCDLLIVAVKYPDLDGALETMRTSVGEDTVILSVMNGITTEGIIGERYGMERVIPAVAQGMDAMRFGTILSYTKRGQVHVGVDDPAKQEKLDRVTAFFDRAGIAYVVEEDIRRRIWSKFMVNVGLNQACMVCGADYGAVTLPGKLPYMIMVSAMREVILLARAEGVELTEADLKEYLLLLRTFSPQAKPSMEQDHINRRPSEVEMFAGTVIPLAQKHGIPVPTNEYLYRRIRRIEAEYGTVPIEPERRVQPARPVLGLFREGKTWTSRDLKTILDFAGVPPQDYDLTGRGLRSRRLCLDRKKGKWTVCFAQEGAPAASKFFDTQDQACKFLYDRLLWGNEKGYYVLLSPAPKPAFCSEEYVLNGKKLVWEFDKTETGEADFKERENNLCVERLWNMRDTVGYTDACVDVTVLSEDTFCFITDVGFKFTMQIRGDDGVECIKTQIIR